MAFGHYYILVIINTDNNNMEMKLLTLILCLSLYGCFGAEIFKIGGVGVKTGDIITIPNKIETITKDK